MCFVCQWFLLLGLLEIDLSLSTWITIGRAAGKSKYFISYRACIITHIDIMYSALIVEIVTVFWCLLFHEMGFLVTKNMFLSIECLVSLLLAKFEFI